MSQSADLRTAAERLAEEIEAEGELEKAKMELSNEDDLHLEKQLYGLQQQVIFHLGELAQLLHTLLGFS